MSGKPYENRPKFIQPNFRTLLIDFSQCFVFCVEKPFNFKGGDFNSTK